MFFVHLHRTKEKIILNFHLKTILHNLTEVKKYWSSQYCYNSNSKTLCLMIVRVFKRIFSCLALLQWTNRVLLIRCIAFNVKVLLKQCLLWSLHTKTRILMSDWFNCIHQTFKKINSLYIFRRRKSDFYFFRGRNTKSDSARSYRGKVTQNWNNFKNLIFVSSMK